MSYLPNKNKKTKRMIYAVLGVAALLALFTYTPVLSVFGKAGVRVGAFFAAIGNGTTHAFQTVGDHFRSKRTLADDKRTLEAELVDARTRLRDRDLLAAENATLKEMMDRSESIDPLLAAVLAKPNHSPYDTLLLDVGVGDRVHIGDEVLVAGTILIGRVSDVYDKQSKVKLFSTAGEETSVRFSGSGADFILRGRGGGAFEILAPKDFPVETGEGVFIPGVSSPVAEVVKVSDDTHNASKAIYLRMPVNMYELNFVEIRRHAR